MKKLGLVVGLSSVLGAGALGVGVLGVTQLPNLATAQNATEASALTEYEQNTIDVIAQYGPSVVSVEVSARVDLPGTDNPNVQVPEGLEDFLDQLPLDQLPPQFREYLEEQGQQFGTPDGEAPQLPPQQGSGSGFVIDDAGRIITNFHVVRAALQEDSVELTQGSEITVTFPENDESYRVRVVGANDFYDLALLELEDPSSEPDSARPIPIADSDALQVGQKTIAIGNPFGFEFSVTTGVVSGVSRSLPGFGAVDVPLVQTDAAINPGNSGGPLLNSAGEVIGVNTAIIPGQGPGFGTAGNIGLGFAVPSNILNTALAQLEQGGLTTLQSRARLGVRFADLSDLPNDVRSDLNLPDEGLLIQVVESGSAAEKAGLEAGELEMNIPGSQGSFFVGGDIITAVNGEPVATGGELQNAILSRGEGDTIELTYIRDGKEQTTEVTLSVVPEQNQQQNQDN